MGDFKIDMVVRESKRRKVVDKVNDVSPEKAIFLLDSKYCGSVKDKLVKEVDGFIDFYKPFFNKLKK